MRSGFAKLRGPLRRFGSVSNGPPPSYKSNSIQENDDGSALSWRSSSTGMVVHPTRSPDLTATPIPPVAATEVPATGGNQAADKFLKINYDGKSVLVIRPEQFEAMVETVREMFSLPDTKPLFASADVPSFDNEQMLLHRGVWPVISRDISVVWISDSADLGLVNPSVTDSLVVRTTQPEDAFPDRVRTVKVWSYQHLTSFSLDIRVGATIQELSREIIQAARDRSIFISELETMTIVTAESCGRVLLDTELASEHNYDIQIQEYLVRQTERGSMDIPQYLDLHSDNEIG